MQPHKWNWAKKQVGPEDILDALNTLVRKTTRYQADLMPAWTPSSTYLEWSQHALDGKSDFGRDAAVCYAKRAVCRQIDSLIIANHLKYFLARSYPAKMELLTHIGCDVPDIIHQLIIDPRNDVEHQYQLPTLTEAKQAVELAKLFLKATADEAKRQSVIAFAWTLSFKADFRDTETEKYERVEYSLKTWCDPMLLIDFTDDAEHVALILRPKDSEIIACPLKKFDAASAVRFAKKLREYHEFNTGNWSTMKPAWMMKLKADLALC